MLLTYQEEQVWILVIVKMRGDIIRYDPAEGCFCGFVSVVKWERMKVGMDFFVGNSILGINILLSYILPL